ncbi:MAG: hypothetical protein CMC55_00160 [Flavobacteriaceae bacterium]|nr:hypothetical protein [Flavobacteriaceae bacterium]
MNKMKNKIMLVKCRFDGNIEGFVNTKEDFKLWLISHNKDREEEEKEDEFDLIEINKCLEK